MFTDCQGNRGGDFTLIELGIKDLYRSNELTMKYLTSFTVMLLMAGVAFGQCQTWMDSPRKDEAEEAHVLYRQAIRQKDYPHAYEHWQVAFEIAPAADGQRVTHFTDGVEIYKHFYTNETDEAKKDEYKQKIMELYDDAIECMKQGHIVYKNCSDETCRNQRIGKLLGNKAYDMFYTFFYPRAETYEVLKESISYTGTAADYTVLYPYPAIVVYLYETGKVSKEKARDEYKMLNEIADYGADNHPTYSEYYKQAKDAISATYAVIEKHIFDCDYFVAKYTPEYEADSMNITNMRLMIKSLKESGCSTGTPFLATLESAYAKYATAYNDSIRRAYLDEHPEVEAKEEYDNGNYSKAISLYKKAIEREADEEKKASYHFAIGSIQFRKLGQYTQARESARTAARLRSNWGRPYMLIGDMYAKSSSSCGSDAYSRGLAVLAAIEKWAYAKSLDNEVASEANKKIATYSDHIPPQDDAFMMGKVEGQKETVGCWIGETVNLRFN
jgi:tetratricopeptide (TPR) repeat protein